MLKRQTNQNALLLKSILVLAIWPLKLVRLLSPSISTVFLSCKLRKPKTMLKMAISVNPAITKKVVCQSWCAKTFAVIGNPRNAPIGVPSKNMVEARAC
ncbi:hypothetical protein D3C81_1746540 [compost metagenome]